MQNLDEKYNELFSDFNNYDLSNIDQQLDELRLRNGELNTKV